MAESQLSREELKAAKQKWKVKSKVEIYSSSRQKWFKGYVSRIFEDDEGEWLVIKYGANNEKEIQRYSQGIRPILKNAKSKRKKKKETKPATKRKTSYADTLKADTEQSPDKSPSKSPEKSPEKSPGKTDGSDPMEASPATPDLAAEAKRRMEASIRAKKRDTDRLKAVGTGHSKKSLAEKVDAEMKRKMADIAAKEEETRRLKKEEEERLRFIAEQELRRKKDADSIAMEIEVETQMDTDKVDENADGDGDGDCAMDNIPWCQCVGALYDADTLKCIQCGKDWFIPQKDPTNGENLEGELMTLYRKRGQPILGRVTDRNGFEGAGKEDQAVIVQLICMLMEMRRVDQALYELFLDEEMWAQTLMTVYNESVGQ